MPITYSVTHILEIPQMIYFGNLLGFLHGVTTPKGGYVTHDKYINVDSNYPLDNDLTRK